MNTENTIEVQPVDDIAVFVQAVKATAQSKKEVIALLEIAIKAFELYSSQLQQIELQSPNDVSRYYLCFDQNDRPHRLTELPVSKEEALTFFTQRHNNTVNDINELYAKLLMEVH